MWLELEDTCGHDRHTPLEVSMKQGKSYALDYDRAFAAAAIGSNGAKKDGELEEVRCI